MIDPLKVMEYSSKITELVSSVRDNPQDFSTQDINDVAEGIALSIINDNEQKS